MLEINSRHAASQSQQHTTTRRRFTLCQPRLLSAFTQLSLSSLSALSLVDVLLVVMRMRLSKSLNAWNRSRRSFSLSPPWMHSAGKLHSTSSFESVFARWTDLTKMMTWEEKRERKGQNKEA